ncbi:hypothetical protein JTE90_025524 [Oedothorax gibbosus]|uniref:Uncharacterized protein n=1 Tax=Oedothorax gibbosus TaxID=931172 RepID=A0AAV6TX76_9ARAC|nr:hypothetical protein JTE90_025524 [Oedothorax gibbosus]
MMITDMRKANLDTLDDLIESGISAYKRDDTAMHIVKTTADVGAATRCLNYLKIRLPGAEPEFWIELVKGTCLEPQEVANIPVSNKFQPLAESMELSSDAQFPTAGTATPDAPFPEVCPVPGGKHGCPDGQEDQA